MTRVVKTSWFRTVLLAEGDPRHNWPQLVGTSLNRIFAALFPDAGRDKQVTGAKGLQSLGNSYIPALEKRDTFSTSLTMKRSRPETCRNLRYHRYQRNEETFSGLPSLSGWDPEMERLLVAR